MSRMFLLYLGSLVIRSGCLALLAAVAAFRVRNAAIRHAIWATVMGGMLVMPVLDMVLPLTLIPSTLKQVAARHVPVMQAFVPAPSFELAAPPTFSPSPVAPRAAHVWRQDDVAVALYLLVAIILLARLALAYRGVRRLRMSAVTAAVPGLEEAAVAHRFGWPLPEVCESGKTSVPLTVGFVSPAVILPKDWRTWDDRKRKAVLCHELAHVRRRDWAITVVAAVNRCLFWFNPLSWWLEARLCSLAEEASDEASVRLTGDASRYAEVLLEFAAASQKGPRLLLEGVTMAKHQVRRRIEQVLANRHPGSGVLGKAAWMTVLALVLPFVYTAAAMQVASNAPAASLRSEAREQYPLQTIVEGYTLSPGEVQEAEQRLLEDPRDLPLRLKLVGYYFLNAIPQPRLQHIFWIIENHPESPLNRAYQMALSPRSSPMNSPADYEHAKDLWLAQTRKHPRNADVLLNASEVLHLSDPGTAEELLLRVLQLRPSTVAEQRLLSLYATAVASSFQPATPGLHFPIDDLQFAAKVRAMLESTQDAALLGKVGESLIRIGTALSGHHVVVERQKALTSVILTETAGAQAADAENIHALKQLSDHHKEYGRVLLRRALALDPSNRNWSALLTGEPSGQQAEQTNPAGEPKALLHVQYKVAPAYPPIATQARIQGVVRLSVTVGPDGRVTHARALSGHPLLISPALDAVKQWIFKLPIVDHKPGEVTTVVDVPFKLP